MVFLPETARSGGVKGRLNYAIYVLNVSITNDTEGELYTLEIKNRLLPRRKRRRRGENRLAFRLLYRHPRRSRLL